MFSQNKGPFFYVHVPLQEQSVNFKWNFAVTAGMFFFEAGLGHLNRKLPVIVAQSAACMFCRALMASFPRAGLRDAVFHLERKGVSERGFQDQ